MNRLDRLAALIAAARQAGADSADALLVENADMPYFEIDASTGLLLLLHEQWLSPHSSAPCTVRAALYASAVCDAASAQTRVATPPAESAHAAVPFGPEPTMSAAPAPSSNTPHAPRPATVMTAPLGRIARIRWFSKSAT
jgi:hypothetical protein